MRLGRMKSLADWLTLLPPDRVEGDGWLLYWDGRCRLGLHPREALQRFERAFDSFMREGDHDGADLAWAACIRAIVLDSTSMGDLDAWIERAPTWDRAEPVEAEVIAAITLALTYRGRASEAASWVARGLSLAPRLDDAAVQGTLIGTILVYCGTMGDTGAASALLDTLRTRSQVDPLEKVFVTFAEALLSWLTGDERGCLKNVEEGMVIAAAAGAWHLSDRMLVLGCLSALGRRDARAAHRFVDRLRQLAASGRPFDVASYHYAQGQEALFLGDLVRAAQVTKTSIKLVTEIDIPSLRLSALLLAANIAFEAQRSDEARALLEQARDEPRPLLYSRLLLEAAVALSQGQRHEAVALVERAFLLGRELGLYNSPWPTRERLGQLCSEALEAGVESLYARELVKRLELFPREPPLLVRDWPWRLQVFTLGRLSLRQNGEPIDIAGAQPGPLRLLKALVALRAYGGRSVAAGGVIDALWPDLEGDAAMRSLHTTLHRLRRLLDDDDAIELRHGELALTPSHCWVDLWAFDHACALRGVAADAALSLYTGPFLATEDPGWIVAARERERDRFARHLLRLGHELEQAGRGDEALDLYRRGLVADDQARQLRAALAKSCAAKSA
jgi:DNA-binding SARP family transcriptional activator